MLHPTMPEAATNYGFNAMLALLANLACFYSLYAPRQDNLNLRSASLCSRNDLFANLEVLLAAGASYALKSWWPDIVVGALIVMLFISSAIYIICQAIAVTLPLNHGKPAKS